MVELPEGYALQGVHSVEDGRQYAAVSHGAFRPHDDREAYCGARCVVYGVARV